LESLKASVARLISLLKQALRNAFGEGPSNQPVTFIQTPTSFQLEERMSEYGQEP
jgi:hypothetical protein